MALHEVLVPGVGTVHAGFDWVTVSSLDGEFKRAADRNEASWFFSIQALDGIEDRFLAFAKKNESKNPPIAGASLIIKALKEHSSFISLLKIDENAYWLLGVENGVPFCEAMSQSVDSVADYHDTLLNLRNLIAHQQSSIDTVLYTDCDEIVREISFSGTVHDFSVDDLSESFSKKDLQKIKFKRYTKVPIIGIPVTLFLFVLIGGGAWYYLDQEAKDYKKIQERKRQELIQRKNELSSQVEGAINAAPPVAMSVNSYLKAIADVPPNISGWALSGISCGAGQCNLTYKPRFFATWSGYLDGKPAAWPEPAFGSDFGVVNQSLPVLLPDYEKRTQESLGRKTEIIFEFGNAAQLAKELDISMSLSGDPARVAGGVEDSWVPLSAGFSVSGPIYLLQDLVDYLPRNSGLEVLDIQIGSKIIFDLKGVIYAKP